MHKLQTFGLPVGLTPRIQRLLFGFIRAESQLNIFCGGCETFKPLSLKAKPYILSSKQEGVGIEEVLHGLGFAG